MNEIKEREIRTQACLEMASKTGTELTLWDRESFSKLFGTIGLWQGFRDGSIIDLGDDSIGLLWRGEI